MSRLGRVGSIVLLLACRTPGDLVGPTGVKLPPAPQFSVVVFDVTDLGSPLGGDFGRAVALNDLGEVVGQSSVPAGSDRRAFHWINGAVRDLPCLLAFATCEAADVNASGLVVGTSSSSLDPSSQAVSWDGDVIEPLALLPVGTLETIARQAAQAINDLGEIVGSAVVQTEFGVEERALYWSDKNAAAPLVLLSLGGESTRALEINNLGQIVGESHDLSGTSRPVFWASKDAAPTPLLPLPGETDLSGSATGINELGQIVGITTPLSSGTVRAVVWLSQGAVPADLGSGLAADINELGQIVGTAFEPTSTAALWHPETTAPGGYQVYRLGGLPEAEFGISGGYGVNNTGQAVGDSRPFGEFHATLWSIPILAPIQVTPSPIKVDGKGYVRVAILTNPWFNASNVDPSSLTLGNDDGLDPPIARKKKLTPRATLVDADRDGDVDLVAEFEEKLLMSNGDLTAASTSLTLLGRLQNGKPIRGVGGVAVQ